jgi:hypothetical protein
LGKRWIFHHQGKERRAPHLTRLRSDRRFTLDEARPARPGNLVDEEMSLKTPTAEAEAHRASARIPLAHT